MVDTNALLDVFTDDQDWSDWSGHALASALDDGALVINPLIYAELSTRFTSPDSLDHALAALNVRRDDLPYEAAFSAGSAFLSYRRRGGSRTSTLPDFYIGAHASVRGYTLLTRDRQRYSTYFPELTLITP